MAAIRREVDEAKNNLRNSQQSELRSAQERIIRKVAVLTAASKSKEWDPKIVRERFCKNEESRKILDARLKLAGK
jgi:hypothetical protein